MKSLSCFQNDEIPGLMYFVSAVLMISSSLICCLFHDTTDKILEDTFKDTSSEQSVTVNALNMNDNDKKSKF
jgi:hypothetical protein